MGRSRGGEEHEAASVVAIGDIESKGRRSWSSPPREGWKITAVLRKYSPFFIFLALFLLNFCVILIVIYMENGMEMFVWFPSFFSLAYL